MVRSAFGSVLTLPNACLEPSGACLFPSFETPREGALLLRMRSNLAVSSIDQLSPRYDPAKTSSVPFAAAGATQTAPALRTPALPTAFSAAARSDVAITMPALPRSGNPANETSG